MFIQIEKTPNPNTLKFILGFNILNGKETVNFSNINEVKNSKLVVKIFQLKHVVKIFLGYDFISITKLDVISWNTLKVEILIIINDHFSSRKNVFDDYEEDINKNNTLKEEFFNDNDIEIVKRIKELMEVYIKPSVIQDGGDIKFRGYKNGIVYVELQGACSGCPSATITLKNGVQNMLCYHIPEVYGVETIL